jgi:biotin transporter BioY
MHLSKALAVGFIPAVFIIGWISEKGRHRIIVDTAAMICGAAVIYACGITWLLVVLPEMHLSKALAVGFIPAVFIIGWISEKGRHRIIVDTAAMICGAAVIYACGITWLLVVLPEMHLSKALAVGMLPFLPGDALKIAAAVPIARAVRPIINARMVTTPDKQTAGA